MFPMVKNRGSLKKESIRTLEKKARAISHSSQCINTREQITNANKTIQLRLVLKIKLDNQRPVDNIYNRIHD